MMKVGKIKQLEECSLDYYKLLEQAQAEYDKRIKLAQENDRLKKIMRQNKYDNKIVRQRLEKEILELDKKNARLRELLNEAKEYLNIHYIDLEKDLIDKINRILEK